MCGIAGVGRIGGGPLTEDADGLLTALAEALAHRGPDERRLLRDGPVGLAFQRLSLVDVEGGGQPLVSADGSLVLIANGEVYNHRELVAGLRSPTRMRTRSDCEVLLSLYREKGVDFLADVRGMFGLVLWDRARGRLVLARDRFGIKPLYYHADARRILFASQITALFADPATPRRLDWEQALTHQALNLAPTIADPEPVTWFEGIEQVAPGTILEIDLRDGTTREHTYWRLPRAGERPRDDLSDSDFIGRFAELLAASVAECATADVGVGLFLSGGVDSAAVAALAGTVPTFTVLSASTLVNGDAESAHRVASALGLPNHQVVFPAGQVPGVEEWKRLLWLTETPQCGPEQYYKHELHRFVRAHFPGVKAMLLGAAADEYTGGYSVDNAGGGGWDDYQANLRWMARRGALHGRPGLAPWWEMQDLALLTDDAVAGYTGRAIEDPYADYVAWKFRDIAQYNCWHEDRTAAGSAIEARVPFLDHRLVELVASIPPALRESLLWDKRIVREAARRWLPPEIADRPKVPFYHGDGGEHTDRMFIRMLARDGGALVEEALAAPTASGLLHGDNIRTTVRQLANDPSSGYVELLLRLVNLGLLEQLTLAPPGPHATAPAAPPPRSFDVRDWDSDREAIELTTIVRPHLDAGTLVAFADGVLLVHEPAGGTWYLVQDGSLTYVVDDPAWLAFLRAVDGKRDIGAALAGASFDAISTELAEAVRLGVLVVRAKSRQLAEVSP